MSDESEISDSITSGVTEDAVDEVMKDVVDGVTEDVVDGVTEDVVDEATEDVVDEATEISETEIEEESVKDEPVSQDSESSESAQPQIQPPQQPSAQQQPTAPYMQGPWPPPYQSQQPYPGQYAPRPQMHMERPMFPGQMPPGPMGQMPHGPMGQMLPGSMGQMPHGLMGQMPPGLMHFAPGARPMMNAGAYMASRPPNPETDTLVRVSPGQMAEFSSRIRAKFRNEMPWDWLGQRDVDWYSSWFLGEWSFVLFRMGLAAYAIWCLNSAWDLYMSGGWHGFLQRYLDGVYILRVVMTVSALLCVAIGVTGSGILSLARNSLPHGIYKKLCDHRVNRGWITSWRSFALSWVVNCYDLAPVMALCPLIPQMLPNVLFDTPYATNWWQAASLPALVLMDWILVKRCRFNHVVPRRWAMFLLVASTVVCLVLTFSWRSIKGLLSIYHPNSVVFDFIPVVMLALGYGSLIVIGSDLMFEMTLWKGHFLQIPEIGIRPADLDDMSKEAQEYYGKKQRANVAKQMTETKKKFEEQMTKFRAKMKKPAAATVAGLPEDKTK